MSVVVTKTNILSDEEFDSLRQVEPATYMKMLRTCFVAEFKVYGTYGKIKEWLYDNASHLFFIREEDNRSYMIYFEDDSDATKFKLFWDGCEEVAGDDEYDDGDDWGYAP